LPGPRSSTPALRQIVDLLRRGAEPAGQDIGRHHYVFVRHNYLKEDVSFGNMRANGVHTLTAWCLGRGTFFMEQCANGSLIPAA
jgi:hypothetical protein